MSVLVTGASGKLGAHVVTRLVEQGRAVTAWSGSRAGRVAGVPLTRVDLTDFDAVRTAFEQAAPTEVIHCAAVSAIGDCYKDPELANQVNHRATGLLSQLAPRLVYTSTDLVFDGCSPPYHEESEPKPLSIYGSSKRMGETACLDFPNSCVVRVSLLYGNTMFDQGVSGFFEQQIEALTQGRTLKLFVDEFRTPLALDEAAGGLVRLLDSGATGIFHLAGPERLSRYQMGVELAEYLKVDPRLIEQVYQKSLYFPEPRPSDVSLSCKRAKREMGWEPSRYREGLARVIGTRQDSRPEHKRA